MGPLASLTPKEQVDEERRECLATIAELAARLDMVRSYMDRQPAEVRVALIGSREWQTVVSLSVAS